MEFKVGDKVRVVKWEFPIDPREWIGKVGEVTSIRRSGTFPLEVRSDDGMYGHFADRELERAE